MSTPPQGPQSNQPGGQSPPPPGYGPPSQGGAQPPPPPGYGPPQGQPAAPQNAGPAQEWGYPSTPPKKSRTKTWVALGVAGAFALALCGGGGLFAYSKLGGGGPQPETALPAETIGYVKVDLDPSADQKVDMVRFANKFPAFKDEIGTLDEDDDLRKQIFESIQEEGGLEDVDYEKDVEPWLGKRFAVAALPSDDGSGPQPVIVLASEDKEAAEEGLSKMTDGDGYCSVQDDFALCGEEQSVVDDAVTGAEEGSLADDEEFSQDMDDLGEDGIASAWFDMSKAKELDPAMSSASTEGRIAMALRFDGPTVELAGRMNGLPEESVPSGDGTSVEALPEDTAAALGIAGLDDSITSAWPEVEKNLDDVMGPSWQQDIETQTGLQVPEDIAKALGSDTVLSVGADPTTPKVALRTNGDRSTIDDMVELIQGPDTSSYPSSYSSGGPQVFVKDGDEDRVVVSNDEGYAEEVASGSGLGDSEAFKDAVPDADKASVVGFVDIASLVENYGGEMDADERANAEVLSAVGFSASGEDDHADFSVRLTTK
ncbi:DUF3352 domain-containing protein [Janibacter corallicola]|uniref:DUF3352 domain-containing protein n=1 Tax=Janibacter corallicola TaxID=415212 RepID=UPI00082E8664|nr:DUF3352 domain-containing protein [Janibacter corallicola]